MLFDSRPLTLNDLALTALSIYNARKSNIDRKQTWESFLSLLQEKNTENSRNHVHINTSPGKAAAYGWGYDDGVITKAMVDRKNCVVLPGSGFGDGDGVVPRIAQYVIGAELDDRSFSATGPMLFKINIGKWVNGLVKDAPDSVIDEYIRKCDDEAFPVLSEWQIRWPHLLENGKYLWSLDKGMTIEHFARHVVDYIKGLLLKAKSKAGDSLQARDIEYTNRIKTRKTGISEGDDTLLSGFHDFSREF